MKNFVFARRVLALSCLLVFQQSAFAADELLLKAKQHLDAKRAADAYALLSPLESQRAGEADYDYLLGLAALESGKPTEAVFALERFLAVNPNHAAARLDLARAYFMTGETTASREEFETVKRQQPVDQVNQITQKYLDSIKQPAAGTSIRGYVELAAGYDNNANSATSANALVIPGFALPVPLGETDRQRGDQFASLAAGMHVRHVLSSAWALDATANIGQRKYDSLEIFDLAYLDGSVGFTHLRGADQFTAALQYQKINVDDHSYRQSYGLLGQWQHMLDDRRQVTAFGQITRLSYEGTQDIRDADRYTAGAAYSHAFSGSYSPAIYAGLYAGMEDGRRSGFTDPFGSKVNLDYLNNKFAGIRLGGQITLSPVAKLIANARHEHRRFDGENPSYLMSRNDRQTDLSLALSYAPALFWTIRPEIGYTDNRSNLDLYDFSRTQYSVTVRRDFN